jgi:hypothetical protein
MQKIYAYLEIQNRFYNYIVYWKAQIGYLIQKPIQF